MRKIIKQFILISIVIFTISVNGQSKEEICKKWYLDGYIFLGIPYSPEKKEKNDFMNFKIDNTFTNMDEGVFGKGIWKWDMKNKTIYLSDNSAKESLPMKLIKLSKNQLIVLLEDEKNSIKVSFKTKK